MCNTPLLPTAPVELQTTYAHNIIIRQYNIIIDNFLFYSPRFSRSFLKSENFEKEVSTPQNLVRP